MISHLPTETRRYPLVVESLDDGAAAFTRVRRRLFCIAHRVLGNWTEAEDVVQDAWLRWQGCDRSTVLNPTAFLVTATTRLAINAAECARARRESYVGEWTPEPVDAAADPASQAVRSNELELGMLLMTERLTSTERAAYVLREAFDYPYPRIAGMLRLSEANTRQLVCRAGKKLAASRASIGP